RSNGAGIFLWTGPAALMDAVYAPKPRRKSSGSFRRNLRRDGAARKRPGGVMRKQQCRPETRSVVGKVELCVVQLGHGHDKAEAETGARRMAACLKPHETIQHAGAVFR